MKFFSDVVKGLKWVGKEIIGAPGWIGKVVTVTRDVEQDAETLCPQLVKLLGDAETLSVAVVKDGGAALISAETLTAAVVAAVAAKGANIAADAAVIAAVEAFAKEVTNSANWTDALTAIKTLVKDVDEFGASAKAAILKLEADVAV